MWYPGSKKMFEMHGLNTSMMNSPLAFPRLPRTAKSPYGISKTGMLKESIIQDNASMLAKLFDFQIAFQQYASNLFDLMPSNSFMSGHPMNTMNAMNFLESENERLKKENATLKQNLEKFKKK
jgi:hypothetical protein